MDDSCDDDECEFEYVEEQPGYPWQWQLIPAVAFELGENLCLAFAGAFQGLKSGALSSLRRRLDFADASSQIEALSVVDFAPTTNT